MSKPFRTAKYGFYIGICIFFLLSSGQAEDISEAGIKGVALIIALVALLEPLVKFVFCTKKNNLRKLLPLITIGFLPVAGFYIGLNISKKAEDETKRRGDVIMSHVSSYFRENRKFPERLIEIKSITDEMLQPKLKKSRYLYSVSEDKSDASIKFASVAFTICQRSVKTIKWTCDD